MKLRRNTWELHEKSIRQWLEEGKKKNATNVIIVADMFDYEDYPVFVMPGENCKEKAAQYNGKDMQQVMEVYSLKKDIEKQINTFRNFEYD